MKFFLFVLVALTMLVAKGIVLPKHFTADFSQMVTNPKNKVLNYHGKIYFLAPSVLKWQYKNPTQKDVCVDGHNMILVDYDLEQVSYMMIEEEFDFVKILKHAKLHHGKVYVSTYKEQKYTIQLDEKKQLQSLAYFDNLDNKVQILFSHIDNKNTLSKADISCVVPKDFDIIED